MNAPRARALLYVLYPSHFKVMIRAARLLQESGRWDAVLFFDVFPPYERDFEEALRLGVACLGPDGVPLARESVLSMSFEAAATASPGVVPIRKVPFLSRLPERLKDRLRRIRSAVLGLADRTLFQLLSILRRMRRMGDLLDRERPALVVLPGDSISYGTPMLVQQARARKISTVITPFTISNALEVVCDLRRFRDYDLDHFWNRLTALLFPRWAFARDGREFLRAPPFQVVAMEALSLAPPNPWVLNSGRADVLAVESEFMRDYYLRENMPADRWPITGNLGDDVLAEVLASAPAQREALYRELGLPQERPMVLLALSDFSYFFRFTRHDEFESYEQMVAFWLDSLAAIPGWNAVISLHPWMRYEEKRHLERPGVRIAQRPIESLVPLCDLYVASISATVRMALACGKPVVDHDPFAFRLENFQDVDGVFVVESRADFTSRIESLTRDPTLHSEISARMRQASHRFGVLDGRAGARMLALFDRLGGCEGAVVTADRAAVGTAV